MRKVNRLQRLARQEEENIIKRIFILSAVSLVIIIIFFTTGIPFLGKFADLLDVVFKNNANENTVSSVPVQAPIIDSLPPATNNENLTITGFSNNAQKVEIYLDGEKIGEINVEAGRFKFDDVKLRDGENEITAKAYDSGGNASEFSQLKQVVLDKKEPTLEVSAPSDSQDITGNNRVKVEGKAEKDAQVYVNGFLANVSSEGKFEVQIPLTEGENVIEVKAYDEAGNTKVVNLKINYRK